MVVVVVGGVVKDEGGACREKKRESMFMQLSRTREVPLRLWPLKPSRKLKETDISNRLRSLQTVGMDEYFAEDPIILNSHSCTRTSSLSLPRSPGRTPTVDSSLHPAIGREDVQSLCLWVSHSCSPNLWRSSGSPKCKCSTQFSELQTREWVGVVYYNWQQPFPRNPPRQITTTTTTNNHGEQHISCNFIFVSRSIHNLVRNLFSRKDRLIPTNKNSVHRIPALEILSPHKSLIQANTFPVDSIPSFPTIASSSIEVQGDLLFSLAE